jgi:hypothetical protein
MHVDAKHTPSLEKGFDFSIFPVTIEVSGLLVSNMSRKLASCC